MNKAKNSAAAYNNEGEDRQWEEQKKKEAAREFEMARTTCGESLIAAARAGEADKVQKLLTDTKFPDIVNFTDYENFTPLMKAAMYDQIRCELLLLDAGADTELVEARGRNALMMAAANGSISTCRLLVDKGAKTVAPRANNGWCAAMFAAANGHYPTLQYLLEVGGPAILGIKDNFGLTALEHARAGMEEVDLHVSAGERSEAAITAGYTQVIALLEAAAERRKEARRKRMKRGPSIDLEWEASREAGTSVRRGSLRRGSTAITLANNMAQYARRFSAWGVHRPRWAEQDDELSASKAQGKKGTSNVPKPVEQMSDPGFAVV